MDKALWFYDLEFVDFAFQGLVFKDLESRGLQLEGLGLWVYYSKLNGFWVRWLKV